MEPAIVSTHGRIDSFAMLRSGSSDPMLHFSSKVPALPFRSLGCTRKRPGKELPMIKRWFESSPSAEGKKSVAEAPPPQPPAPRPPVSRFGIGKVVEMVNSQHLLGLSPDAKRCAVMMTLEA